MTDTLILSNVKTTRKTELLKEHALGPPIIHYNHMYYILGVGGGGDG